MKDDVKISVKWNSNTAMYQASVDLNGSKATFALPDAVNDWDARNKAQKVIRDYQRETSK